MIHAMNAEERRSPNEPEPRDCDRVGFCEIVKESAAPRRGFEHVHGGGLMLKTVRVALVAAVTAIALTAAAQAQDKKVTLRIASAFDQNTDMMQAAKRFGDLVKERSGGSIDVKIFAGGQMGGEKDNLEALKLGGLEMGVFGTYPIVTLTPKYSFFDAPFVFRDKDHVYKVWNGKLGNEVRDVFTKTHGIHSLGMMGRGYRHLTSNT